MCKKFLSLSVIICFFLTTLGPIPKAHADLGLPAPGSMVNLSPAYIPVIMKGLRVHPENPLLFDFIMDTGNSDLKVASPEFKTEAQKLIKYFLATLTIKESDLWVNLSPYEKNRMITEELGKTELGRDMLAQDYILKQLTASLIYPEKQLGKEFWNRVYTKAQQEFGTSDIPVNTFNKVWIVADRAKILERNNVGYVVSAHMKVMLEEDYLALQKHSPLFRKSNNTHSIGSSIVRQIILPEIEKEVNQGQNFAPLRQIYYSMILATWYKMALKNALLNEVYSNKNKTSGVLSNDPAAKEKIYEQYLKAYKKGVFNYIKQDIDASSQQTIPRKYFSGGEVFHPSEAMVVENKLAPNESPAMLAGGKFVLVAVAALAVGLTSALANAKQITTQVYLKRVLRPQRFKPVDLDNIIYIARKGDRPGYGIGWDEDGTLTITTNYDSHVSLTEIIDTDKGVIRVFHFRDGLPQDNSSPYPAEIKEGQKALNDGIVSLKGAQKFSPTVDKQELAQRFIGTIIGLKLKSLSDQLSLDQSRIEQPSAPAFGGSGNGMNSYWGQEYKTQVEATKEAVTSVKSQVEALKKELAGIKDKFPELYQLGNKIVSQADATIAQVKLPSEHMINFPGLGQIITELSNVLANLQAWEAALGYARADEAMPANLDAAMVVSSALYASVLAAHGATISILGGAIIKSEWDFRHGRSADNIDDKIAYYKKFKQDVGHIVGAAGIVATGLGLGALHGVNITSSHYAQLIGITGMMIGGGMRGFRGFANDLLQAAEDVKAARLKVQEDSSSENIKELNDAVKRLNDLENFRGNLVRKACYYAQGLVFAYLMYLAIAKPELKFWPKEQLQVAIDYLKSTGVPGLDLILPPVLTGVVGGLVSAFVITPFTLNKPNIRNRKDAALVAVQQGKTRSGIDAYDSNKATNSTALVGPAKGRSVIGSFNHNGQRVTMVINNPGGIDLNAKNLGLDIEGNGIQMQFNPVMVAQFRKGDFSGVQGIILRIVQIASPLPILDMATPSS